MDNQNSSFHCGPILSWGSSISLFYFFFLPSVGTVPGEGSFAMHAILANHYLFGASYPRGGASEIAFHIIPVIEKAGGKVLVRATVSKILVDENSGKVKGKAQLL